MAKQQNLSLFFTPKIEPTVNLRDGWDRGSSVPMSESNYAKHPGGADIDSMNQGKKRILPSSMGGGMKRDSNSESYVPKQSRPSYPPSSAYGPPKGPPKRTFVAQVTYASGQIAS